MTAARAEWPGILMCVPCEEYVDADYEAEETACEHSWDEARDISHLTDEEWAKLRHDIYIKELEREEPRNRELVLHELTSLVYDLTVADVLPDDYAEREGLEKLLVSGGTDSDG